MDAKRISSLLAGAGVPRRVALAVAKLSNTEAWIRVHTWMESDASTLVLSGCPGAGKTVAAASAVLLEGSGRSLFVRAADMARIGLYDKDEHARLASARLLVIDDLGTEYMDVKGYFLSLLDDVIAGRHADMRRTLITTNMGAEDFKARYRDRVADRVRESGEFMSLAGKSFRSGEKLPELAIVRDPIEEARKEFDLE